jgi:RNA polymerase sigma-70 factor (ECF subfamily)
MTSRSTGHRESNAGARALEHRKLAQAVSSLAPEHAEIVLLGYVEDLSCTEIAARLGIPVGTVKSRVRRALAILREQLGDGTGGTS